MIFKPKSCAIFQHNEYVISESCQTALANKIHRYFNLKRCGLTQQQLNAQLQALYKVSEWYIKYLQFHLKIKTNDPFISFKLYLMLESTRYLQDYLGAGPQGPSNNPN